MAGDTLVNTGGPGNAHVSARSRVLRIQSKLHDWAAADPGRVFDELFNLVADQAFLREAWNRVRTNTGARTAGVDRWTASGIEESAGGVEGFLMQLRLDLKAR